MKCLILLLISVLSAPSFASLEIQSEFRLHINEPTFDTLVNDFGNSLQGTQNIELGNFTYNDFVPVAINGVHAQLNYAFAPPTRVGNAREWSLSSHQISGKIVVDSVSATQVVTTVVNGVTIRVRINAQCSNIVLSLKPGMANVSAKIAAAIAQNQIHLSMADFSASWQQGAWSVDSISCTGFDALVKDAAMKALSSFANIQAPIQNFLTTKFAAWSQDASILLLTQRDLPTNKDYLKLAFEPKTVEDSGNGVFITGNFHFIYPLVSPNSNILYTFALDAAALESAKANNPELVIPFETVRSLMMGEYFSGKLDYQTNSNDLNGFQSLFNNGFLLAFIWPDLNSFSGRTVFNFKMSPMGPPSFTNEKSNGNNVISGDLFLPLSVSMYAPKKGKYVPYVQFTSTLDGSTNLTLQNDGKILMQFKQKSNLDIQYAWSQSYVKNYSPNTYIGTSAMSSTVQNGLNTQGFSLQIPPLPVGKNIILRPFQWNLNGKDLFVDFAAGS